MNPLDKNRRSFLKTAGAMLGAAPFATSPVQAQPQAQKRLIAYVGTFSSPLKDVLPTQVDLPPGNGRGIHFFEIDREPMKPIGVYEMGTSPSCVVVNKDG